MGNSAWLGSLSVWGLLCGGWGPRVGAACLLPTWLKLKGVRTRRMGGRVWQPPTLGVEGSVPPPSNSREEVSKRSCKILGLRSQFPGLIPRMVRQGPQSKWLLTHLALGLSPPLASHRTGPLRKGGSLALS